VSVDVTLDADDPGAVVDALVAAGVLRETADGALSLTDAFDRTLAVYEDSYDDEERVRETVAELFDVAPDDGRARAVTGEELAALLALRSSLDDPPPVEGLAVAAGVVAGMEPASPVPDRLEEVDDGSWHGFVGGGDAVVTVWKRHCDPCDALKGDLDDVLAALAAESDAPTAGLDGESCPDFCRATGVNAAPAVCCFRDGELVEAVTGRRSAADYADLFETVYG
jgi:hypothetical protein